MFQFSFNSVIRGFHVYKDIWENPVPGEELLCQREVHRKLTQCAVCSCFKGDRQGKHNYRACS